MGAVAAIGGLILGAAGTTYGVVKQNEMQEEARAASKAQQEKQDALIAEAQKKEKEQAKAQAEIERQRSLAMARSRDKEAAAQSGRKNTMLTSSLGTLDEPRTARKTLLGA